MLKTAAVVVGVIAAFGIGFGVGKDAGKSEERSAHKSFDDREHEAGPWAKVSGELQLSPTEVLRRVSIRMPGFKSGGLLDTHCLIYVNSDTKASTFRCDSKE